MNIRRRFVRLSDGRHVHYRRAGIGPPLILLHPGIASGAFFEPDMARLGERYTVFAFDNAGFGDSDPLPIASAGIADLADGLAQALDALMMPPAVLFGYHSGAAVAVELAVRHPRFVSGLVVDGMPIFTTAETVALFAGDFAPPLTIDPLGGHFAQTWTRFRDQAAFYPWHDKRPERMLPLADAAPGASVDRWVRYFFQSAAHYAGPFRDAHDYGRAAAERIAALIVPASFVVAANDFLVAHADRMPPLPSGVELLRIGADPAEKRGLLDTLFETHGGSRSASPDPARPSGSDMIARHFVDFADGQILVRSCGADDAPVLILLHDAPGSGADIEDTILALAPRFRVVAPDLPGCGGSAALDGPPTVAAYAVAIDAVRAAYAIDRPILHGIGFGGSIALGAARDCAGLILQGLLVAEPSERDDMRFRYTPPIGVEPDGAHWYRTWLMLRDAEVYFPWYDRRLAAQRRVSANMDGERLHRRTVALLDRRDSYDDPVLAALDHDAVADLAHAPMPILIIRDPAGPLFAHADRLATRFPALACHDGIDPDAIAAHFAL